MDFTTVILIVFVIVALTGLVLWVIFKNRDKSQKGNKEDIQIFAADLFEKKFQIPCHTIIHLVSDVLCFRNTSGRTIKYN